MVFHLVIGCILVYWPNLVQIFKIKFKMVYFQFQMFSIFWVWLTSWFENSVITNLVHLMLMLRLPNLHIPFFITFYIIRAAHLTFWNITVRITEQQVQDSLIAQVFFEISICLLIHLPVSWFIGYCNCVITTCSYILMKVSYSSHVFQTFCYAIMLY